MSTDFDYPPGKSAASLLSGILGDLQRLVEQQFQLTRREIAAEVQQRSGAAAIGIIGIAMVFLSSLEFCLAATHWLHWATSAATADPAQLPLWTCHAIVALVLMIVGGITLWLGQARFNAISATPNPATERKEHHPWTTEPK